METNKTNDLLMHSLNAGKQHLYFNLFENMTAKTRLMRDDDQSSSELQQNKKIMNLINANNKSIAIEDYNFENHGDKV